MNEFDLIRKYFAPLSPDGLVNDGAVLDVSAGHNLVVTSDTLNAGTHFLPDAAPADIAHKALRVNLSDLAALAADPLAYQLNIAFPEAPDATWLAAFTGALAADQKAFGVVCSGGDTTSIDGPLSISITAMGIVPEGQAVSRAGAQAGDLIVLTGPVGDALIGLWALRGEITIPGDGLDYFKTRYTCPVPRLAIAEPVRAYAHAAIDVSDGLVADLEHICEASGVGAEVKIDDIPLSDAAQKLCDEGVVSKIDLITGGDDYELIMAVSEQAFEAFSLACHVQGVELHVIGRFTNGDGSVNIKDNSGSVLEISQKGWQHF